MKYQVAMLTAAMVTATLGANAGRDRHIESPSVTVTQTNSEMRVGEEGVASKSPKTAARLSDTPAHHELPANHDCAIALAATHRLALNTAMIPHPIHVECEAGIVRLSGQVPAPYYRTLAENLVRKVRGVYEVKNELLVERFDSYGGAQTALNRTWQDELEEKTLAYDSAAMNGLDIG